MARPSKIDQLPPELQSAIGELRLRGHTIDEILRKLSELVADQGLDLAALPSRSGLHRHVQGLDRLAERLHLSRGVAEALTRDHGDGPSPRTAQLNLELLHDLIMRLLVQISDRQDADQDGDAPAPEGPSPKDIQALAISLNALASANKSDADMRRKIREEVERAERERAARTTETTLKAEGLSAETVDKIRQRILGGEHG